ncbi:MAG: MopE-related protein [Myxococcota bacterium]|nr:MopE-related protein [Myxococcota bacterium]
MKFYSMSLTLCIVLFSCRNNQKTVLEPSNEGVVFEDADADGYEANEDCDDSDPSINPGVPELCDGVDNNCNGQIDEGVLVTFYLDSDGDGFGDNSESIQGCSQPSGYVPNGNDCDDTADVTFPSANEICDGIDNDCDDLIDEDLGEAGYLDNDRDGYGDPNQPADNCLDDGSVVFNSDDCNDSNDSSYPGAQEYCDGIDNDCDGAIDEDIGQAYYLDQDGDGFGEDQTLLYACTPPSGYVLLGGDCDDLTTEANPDNEEICNDLIDNNCDGLTDENAIDETEWYLDQDNDGYGDPSTVQEACYPPSNQYVSNNTDCDDSNSTISPAALEVCDGIDNDCDTVPDDGLPLSSYFSDLDGDGYGDVSTAISSCSQPSGSVTNSSDCDDNNALSNPGMAELCSTAFDDDCNGQTNDADSGIVDGITYALDADGDGFGTPNYTVIACTQPSGYVIDSTDCDDLSANSFPNAPETCDGLDNDCNSLIDEADSGLDTSTLNTYYPDADSDGFGDANIAVQSCEAPSGYVSDSTDCNDQSSTIYFGATESCNGLDDNCDGLVDNGAIDSQTWYADTDGDNFGNINYGLDSCAQPNGYVSNSIDCDDNNADINPNSVWYIDLDGDGFGNTNFSFQQCAQPSNYVLDNTDCNDLESSTYTGANEICDGIDNDCDGLVDDNDTDLLITNTNIWYADTDNDGYGDPATDLLSCNQPSGYVGNNTDCNDQSAEAYPTAQEICDGIDNDCDNLVDDDDPALSLSSASLWFFDGDNDGFGDGNEFLGRCNQPNGYVSNDEDCDDNNNTINPNGVEQCDGVDNDCDGVSDPDSLIGTAPDCAALDCLEILTDGSQSGDGLYWISPNNSIYQAYCLMDTSYDGGGWTLIAITADDNQNTWTWNNRHYFDTDTTTFGSPSDLNADFKSPAYHEIAPTDMMFRHRPSNVWVVYGNSGNGAASMASLVGSFPQQTYYSNSGGFAKTAGNYNSGGYICGSNMAFHACGTDGGSGCSDSDDSYGPIFNINYNNGCPFDDTNIHGGLGPDVKSTGTERQSIGFGSRLNLNTGSSGSGVNNMQIFVR